MEHNSFVQDFISEFRIITKGDGTIDPLNNTTWGEHNLHRLEEGICTPCAAHQQLAENFLAKTGVNDACRSAPAKNHTIFARNFNTHASELKLKAKEEETNKPCPPQRVVGKQWLSMFSAFARGQLDQISHARQLLGAAKMKQIKRSVREKKLKSSTIKNEERNKSLIKPCRRS